MNSVITDNRNVVMSCGDKNYYDDDLALNIYPDVYRLWKEREQISLRWYQPRKNDTKQLLRRILVDYLAEFCEKNKVNQLSRALAIALFDKFDSSTLLANLCLSYPYDRDLLCADHAVLLMQSCLLVAAKVEDVHYNVPNATDFRNVTMQDSAVKNYLRSCNFPIKEGTPAFESVVSRLKLPKFPLANYRDMELRILRQFNWGVNFPTIASYLGAYITELNLMHKAQFPVSSTPHLAAFIKELVTHAEYLSELALQRPELLYSDVPSFLAAACMVGAHTINMSNSWNVHNAQWALDNFNPVRKAVQDLSMLLKEAIRRVAPQVPLDSNRFMPLVSAVLTSHNENQGEKMPPTPPPDQIDPQQLNAMLHTYQQSPIVTLPHQNPPGVRSRSGLGRHTRSQLQQRQHPYPVSSASTSSSSLSGLSSFSSAVAKNLPYFLEQLTPPETPPILGCSKLAVGYRPNAAKKQSANNMLL